MTQREGQMGQGFEYTDHSLWNRGAAETPWAHASKLSDTSIRALIPERHVDV